LEQLWSSPRTSLTITRAGWVPICLQVPRLRVCCMRAVAPPTANRSSRVHLITNFPGRAPNLSLWPAFRRDAWFALGVHVDPAHDSARDPVWSPLSNRSNGLFLWVVAASGSNGRHIHNEAVLMRSVEALVHASQPTWRFQTLHGSRKRMDYREELSLWARADAVISLFGSAEHNCRFMRAGATLIEIHGALKNNDRFGVADYQYRDICMHRLGVRWLPYAEHGFRLGRNHSASEAERQPSWATASIHQGRFLRFLTRVLQGNASSDEALRSEYAQMLKQHEW